MQSNRLNIANNPFPENSLGVALDSGRSAGSLSDASNGATQPETDTGWSIQGRLHANGPLAELTINASPFRVGRRPENQLYLPDRTVSGNHAVFTMILDDLFVRDLGSTNGTFVNGTRLDERLHKLQDGDNVQFGMVQFRVRHANSRSNGATIEVDANDQALTVLRFGQVLTQRMVVPFFQPLVNLADGSLLGYEALLRCRVEGLESPARLFKAAADVDEEETLSSIAREQSLHFAERFAASNLIFLNTHPVEITSPNLIPSLHHLRDRFPKAEICLEIHEAAVPSLDFLRELSVVLTELDMQLAYDDFGAGQARLVELSELPPDYLKFDIQFVRSLPNASREHRRLVASLVRMAQELGVITIAEGIETAAELEACREVNFEVAQGYFFGRPAPIEHWLASQSASDETVFRR
ncbi:EAL domain-containing protein [Thalassoroseus pseudoceratinae]|uniref:EAL domain-containing protein n=1 Tax=Thalassoroseus pseudoceratinae TaxID=2713176 RepID=UPI00142079F2|nr:EAL domain-containing protein [Thalassoroseus pseudoceratinae]